MFQNILMTSLTPLNSTNEIYGWENRPFTQKFPEAKFSKAQAKLNKIRKPKRKRAAFTTEQLRVLEEVFSKQNYVKAEKRQEIANLTGISDQSIKFWFQNRRIKMKKDLEESSDDNSSPPSVSASIQFDASYIDLIGSQLNAFTDDPQNQYQAQVITDSDYYHQSTLLQQYSTYYSRNESSYPSQSYKTLYQIAANSPGYSSRNVSHNNSLSLTNNSVLQNDLLTSEQKLNFFDLDLNCLQDNGNLF